MSVKIEDFLAAIHREAERDWQNSNLWRETEIALETVAEHLKTCEGCWREWQTWLEDYDSVHDAFFAIDRMAHLSTILLCEWRDE